MTARAGKGSHTVTIRFVDGDALRHFVRTALDPALVVYEADGLDPEFSGNPGRNSWVVRRAGHKPADMALNLDY